MKNLYKIFKKKSNVQKYILILFNDTIFSLVIKIYIRLKTYGWHEKYKK